MYPCFLQGAIIHRLKSMIANQLKLVDLLKAKLFYLRIFNGTKLYQRYQNHGAALFENFSKKR